MFTVITCAPFADGHAYRFESPRCLFLPSSEMLGLQFTILVKESTLTISRGKRRDLLVPMDLLTTTSTLLQLRITVHHKRALRISGNCYLESHTSTIPKNLRASKSPSA